MVKIFLVILGCLAFPLKRESQQLYTISGYAQGTDYSIKYYASRPGVKKESIDSVLSEIDRSMSLYRPGSIINKFNASTGGYPIDKHLQQVVKRSFEIYEDTKGLFDITVAPLVQAWGFGFQPIRTLPDSARIELLLKSVGMKQLSMHPTALHKENAEVQIDVNGIAQGYTVDVVAAYLSNKVIKSYLVEIGGEILVKGYSPGRRVKKIGIEGPLSQEGTALGIKHTIGMTKGAITTSGSYRKYYEAGGRKINHLINPFTGYPLQTEVISATVIAPDAITADGYDNALMAMPIEEAMRFVNARKYLEAYFIYRLGNGAVVDTMTTGFKKLIIDNQNKQNE